MQNASPRSQCLACSQICVDLVLAAVDRGLLHHMFYSLLVITSRCWEIGYQLSSGTVIFVPDIVGIATVKSPVNVWLKLICNAFTFSETVAGIE